MTTINAIRIRRYNRLCKIANDRAAAARFRGYPKEDQDALVRLEKLMEGLSERIETGPR